MHPQQGRQVSREKHTGEGKEKKKLPFPPRRLGSPTQGLLVNLPPRNWVTSVPSVLQTGASTLTVGNGARRETFSSTHHKRNRAGEKDLELETHSLEWAARDDRWCDMPRVCSSLKPHMKLGVELRWRTTPESGLARHLLPGIWEI
jgi:hypothetical protein